MGVLPDPEEKPDLKRWPGARRDMSLVQLLPNMMTVGALCAGLASIRFSAAGFFSAAVVMILLAGVLDGLDGRLARFLKSESPLGAELDSLADFLNFGVAPGMLMYYWAFPAGNDFGWGAVLIYVVCTVLRLARFNIGNEMAAGLARLGKFQGVPSPAGAMLSMTPLYIAWQFPDWPMAPWPVLAGWLVLVGLLMISRLPTPSLKSVRVPTDRAAFVVIAVIALVVLLLRDPWAVMSVVAVGYAVVLLFAFAKALLARA
ncbi:CDP-alcohol phosphatidyltransferase family protein [Tabrizicola oligotrophica]|uniref:Phosphatidylcholine/phosphatidylserine synthase n=1 Tax=Tabrizicola oligotrophica TaxID=2710650 RepID=A0A6M0QPP7_9RHOB|nr:phosphatidylcholine/phosphatidylserine synthase [Tabrizicola oligotrophica]NEY89429.1 phosphatidylcholine/phosphatidylserine synthase [Tabrizicola oligotrophica]